MKEEDNSKYYGKYVVRRFPDDEIIAFDEKPSEAKRKAKEKGCQEPLVEYYPDPEEATAFQKV